MEWLVVQIYVCLFVFFFFLNSIYLYSGAIAIEVLQMVLHELPTSGVGAMTMPTKQLCIVKGGYS